MLYGSALVAERTLAVGDAVAAGVDGLDEVVAAIIRRGFELTAVDAYRTRVRARRRGGRRPSPRWRPSTCWRCRPRCSRRRWTRSRADPFGVNERLGTLTTFTNLLGLPAVVVPIGAGTPVGLQLLGARGRDNELLAFAAGV